MGQYGKALDLLGRRHFHVWEGGGDIHDVYINAHLLEGRQHFAAKRYKQALDDYAAALQFPENLEVGRPEHPPRDGEIYFHLGTAYEALGDNAQAKAHFEKAASEKIDLPEARYFQGLALRKLGQEARATLVFEGLIKSGRQELDATSDSDYFAKFGERRAETVRIAHGRYLMGLGYLVQGRRAEAKVEFEKVLGQNINHLWARVELASLR